MPARLGYPDLASSEGVLGWRDEGDVRYVHLSGSPSSYLSLADKPAGRPWLARANARIAVDAGGWTLNASQPIELEFGNAGKCRCYFDGKPVSGLPAGNGLTRFKHPARTARLEMRCAK
jgi:hypothetical protein